MGNGYGARVAATAVQPFVTAALSRDVGVDVLGRKAKRRELWHVAPRSVVRR